MKEIGDATALVIDHGLFLPVARRLAMGFKRVLYHCPHEVGFPTINASIIGEGFPDIEKCVDIWGVMPEVDSLVFNSNSNVKENQFGEAARLTLSKLNGKSSTRFSEKPGCQFPHSKSSMD